MATGTPVVRPRLAAALSLLFAWAAIGQLTSAFAQQPKSFQISDADDITQAPPVPGEYENAPGDYGPGNYGGSEWGGGEYGGCGNEYGACGCDYGNCGYDYGACGCDYGTCNCNCGQCNQCCDCGPSCWFGVEFLGWMLDGSDLPPLVTESPDSVPLADAGVLGEPDTRILFGNETVGDGIRAGYRIAVGGWLDCCRNIGIGGDYFNVGEDDENFFAAADNATILARPFFNTELNEPDAELVGVPDQLSGSVRVHSDDEFEGAGLTLNQCVWRRCDPCGCGPTAAIKVLSGYRYYHYDSNLVITENLLVLPNTQQPLVPGTTIFVQDRFRTNNEFHGGELGLQGYIQKNCWWVDGLTKVAIGSNRRTVVIGGETVNNVPNVGTASFVGGLLTSEVTNIGRYRDTDAVMIPEFRFGMGRAITCNCAVRAGYNLIIWPDVMRASDALPPGLRVDPRNLPPVQPGGGPDPRFPGFDGSALFAHGMDLAIQWTY
jgi:hypothetical protein